MLKTYPKSSLAKISTTTVVSCAECKTEISMREEHWQTPDGSHFHKGCVAEESTKTKIVEKEKESTKFGGD